MTGRRWGRWGAGAGLGLACVAGFAAFVTIMPGSSFTGTPPPLNLKEQALRVRLEGHVTRLAGEVGARNIFRAGSMDRAAAYIEKSFAEAGYAVRKQPLVVSRAALLARFRAPRLTAKLAGETVVHNIEAEARGITRPGEIIVVGAHYDSVPFSPGANDNATGTAAVLELARLLKRARLRRTVRFVAFANEEAPFFNMGLMGSQAHAAEARRRGDDIRAMLSVETIGYFDDRAGSQRYPFPFALFYPEAGNFIGFVANLTSHALVRRAISAFRGHAPFPSEGVAAPAWLPGIGWSDHRSFWDQGYPAIMITDTAPFRYPFYHRRKDTPEKIRYAALARIVAGLERVVRVLAGADGG